MGDQVQRQFYVLKRQSPLYERVQALGTARRPSQPLVEHGTLRRGGDRGPRHEDGLGPVIGDGVVLHDHQVTHLLQIVDNIGTPCIRVTDRATERDKEIIDEVRDELLPTDSRVQPFLGARVKGLTLFHDLACVNVFRFVQLAEQCFVKGRWGGVDGNGGPVGVVAGFCRVLVQREHHARPVVALVGKVKFVHLNERLVCNSATFIFLPVESKKY